MRVDPTGRGTNLCRDQPQSLEPVGQRSFTGSRRSPAGRRVETASPIESSPVLGDDERLYFGDNGGPLMPSMYEAGPLGLKPSIPQFDKD